MNYLRRSLITVVIIIMSGFSSHAAAPSWDLDKAHSNVYFSITHIFSKVNGFFGDFKTDIRFDPEDLSSSSFMFEIDISSIDTAIAKRDKHLRSADFFDASKYPVITFTSSKVVDKGNNHYDVAGTLMVKGKKYDLILPLELVGVQEHPMKKGVQVAGFNGRLTLDRLDYGIGSGKFYEMGVVDKDVEVFVSMEVLK